MTVAGFDDLVGKSHVAWGEFVKGTPEAAKALWSHSDDVTIANPFGPPRRGWERVAQTMGARCNALPRR